MLTTAAIVFVATLIGVGWSDNRGKRRAARALQADGQRRPVINVREG